MPDRIVYQDQAARDIGRVSCLAGSGKLFAFLRDVLTAASFGVSDQMDAYLVARWIPITAPLLVSGGLNAAAIPKLTQLLASKRDQAAWQFLNRLMTLWVATTGVLAVLSYLVSPRLSKLLAPGFSSVQLALGTHLIQLSLLAFPVAGLGVLINGAFHAQRRFTLPTLSMWLPNLMTVVSLLALRHRLGVASLMWGLLVGELLRVGIQLPWLWRSGWRYSFQWHRVTDKDGSVRRVAQYAGGTVLLTQMLVLMDRWLASMLQPGSIAALGFALRMFTVVHEVLVLSVVTVLLPTFSRQLSLHRESQAHDTLRRSLGLMLLIAVPIAAMACVMARPLIGFVFQRGDFTADGLQLTVRAFRPMAFQIPGAALVAILFQYCYAQGRAERVFFTSLASMSVGILLKLWLVRQGGIRGLATASAIAVNLQAFLLFALLRKPCDDTRWSTSSHG